MSFTDNIKKNLINRNDFTILFVPVFFIIIIFLLFWHTIDSFHHQKKEYIIADLVHNQESLIQFIIKQSFVDKNSSIHSQEMARKKLLEVSRLLAHGGIGYSPFEPNKTHYLKTVKDKRLKKGFQLLEKKIQSWLSMVKETDLLSQTDPKFLELKEKVLSEGEDLTIDIKRINHHLMDHVKEEMSESVNLYIKIIVLGFIIGLLSAYKVIKIKRDLQDEIKQHKITNSRVSKYEHELEKMVEDRTNRLMNALSKIREEDLIRREIEKEMKTSEKRYRQLIEFSPLGILVIYNEKIMYSNALGAEILAVSTTDRIIGQKISDVILPYFKNNLEAIIERVTKHKEEVFWNEEKYVRPDGSNIYMDIMASLVVDDDIEGIQLILRNVTQRKALNDEVYRLATAAEQAAESIVITNIDAEILYVNPAFERSTGYKKEEVIGQSPRLLKSGKHDALYYKTLWDTITVGKVWTGELINKRKNGSLYYEQTSIAPVKDENGTIINFVATKQDITQKIILEKALMSSEKRLKNILVSSPDIILLITPEYIVDEIFTGRDDLLWIPKGSIVGRSLEDLLPIKIFTVVEEHLNKALDDTKPVEFKFQMDINRIEKHFSGLISLVQNEVLESKSNFMVVLRDETEQNKSKLLQEDVERIIRHDLKNPLNGILGYCDLLKADEINTDQLQAVTIIESCGRKMINMIDSSLNLYKIETGTYLFKPEKINLVELLHNIDHEFASYKRRGKHLEYWLDGVKLSWSENYPIVGEPLLLETMFSNLLKNALDAHYKNSPVSVTIYGQEFHQIDIHNSGVIPEEIKDRFFEKYTTSGKKDGTGLGTYTAKLITELHGGQISYESSKDHGTNITILIPKF